MSSSDNTMSLKSTLRKEKNREGFAGTFTAISADDRDGFSRNNRKNRDGVAGTFTAISPSSPPDHASNLEYRHSTGSDGARDILTARKAGRLFTVPRTNNKDKSEKKQFMMTKTSTKEDTKQKKNVAETSFSSDAQDPASSIQSPTDNTVEVLSPSSRDGERNVFDDNTYDNNNVGAEDETPSYLGKYLREDVGHSRRGAGSGSLSDLIRDPMGIHATPTTETAEYIGETNRRRSHQSHVDISDSISSTYTKLTINKSEASASINEDLLRSTSLFSLSGKKRLNIMRYVMCIFFLLIIAAVVSFSVIYLESDDDDSTTPKPTSTPAPTSTPTSTPDFFNCMTQRSPPTSNADTSCTSPSFQSTCYKNTVAILNAEREAFRIYRNNINVNPNATFPPRTYHLCCNIHLDIGQYDYNTDSFSFGMAYINLFLPDVTIMCGPDGSSMNNCTLSGGDNHLVVLPAEYVPGYGIDDSVPIYDVAIHGIMFEGASSSSASIQDVAGGVTFVDCHFRFNRAEEGIISSYITGDKANSSLTEVPAIYMENCTVWHNVLTATSKFPHGGLVYAQRGKVEIINSIFARNWMERTTFGGLLAPIFARYVAEDQTVGGGRMDVTIQDSCFVDNFGATFSPVLVDLDDEGVRVGSGNYYYLAEKVKPVPSQLNLELGVDLNVKRLGFPEQECGGIGEMRERPLELVTNCTVPFDIDFCQSSTIIPC